MDPYRYFSNKNARRGILDHVGALDVAALPLRSINGSWMATVHSDRAAPYLGADQEGRIKCVSCQLCEFVCPPKAIRIVPPGPGGAPEVGNVEKAPKEFEINMLRCIFCGYCQEVCPEEAIFLMRDYSLTSATREELIYNKEKLLALGGVHQDKIRKWKQKAEEAKAQGI